MAWCHACRVEFREGIAACTDCGGALSADPPPPKQYASPALLAKTSSLEEAHAVRTLLEAHGIDCFLENEFGPAFAIGLPTLTVPYGLYVPSDQLESARELVAEARAEGAKAEPEERKPRRWWPWILGTAVLLLAAPELRNDGRAYSIGPWCAWAVILIGVLHFLRTRHPGAMISWPRLLTLAGAGAAVGTILVLVPTIRWRDFWEVDRSWRSVLVGPPLEELGKILGVALVFMLNPQWRSPSHAWMVAGAAAGAGFGLVENVVWYGSGWGDSVGAFASRSGAFFHLVDTLVLGYFVARREIVVGYFLAVAMHAGWNALAVNDLGYLLPAYGGLIFWVLWRRLPSMIRVLDAQETKAGPPTEGPPVASTG